MELVSNPVGGVVAGAVALDGVALDVSDEHHLPPAYAGRHRRSTCDLLLYSPLARLLGHALAVALVGPVAALDFAFNLVVNVARYVRAGKVCDLLLELLLYFPVKLLFCLPLAIFFGIVFLY